jgi:hypothetical protein
MIVLTPSLLVAAATSFVGIGEEGGDNRGQVVELFLRQVRQPAGQPWCAAFVHHVGFWSHWDHAVKKSSWPLPPTASCWELGEFARVRAVLRQEPQVGDVFLTFNKQFQRFAHTGVVARVDRAFASPAGDVQFACTTIEGNTNDDGSREGRTTLARQRRFSIRAGDRFIRWLDLDQRLSSIAA